MKRNALLFGCLVLWTLGTVSYAQDERAYMGVELDSAPLPELLTKHLGLDAGQGIRIRNITVDSPADKAGLERDDIIISFQGKTVTSAEQIVQAVRSAGIGDEVSLEVIHEGQRKTLRLKLAAAGDRAEMKYPPEPEAMMTWRPGKIFKIGPEGREWMEIPFDKIPEFDVDINRFFKELHTYHHATDGEDYTITIEGDPKDDDSQVIVQAGEEEYRTTAGKLEALPEKYQGPARDALENARRNVKRDIVIERKFRLPEPPRPELYQRFFRALPRPDMERWSEQKDRALEKLQGQMERLQQRMEQLEQRNREMLERLLERKGKEDKGAELKPVPAQPQDEHAI